MPSWAVFPLENFLWKTAPFLRKGALRGSFPRKEKESSKQGIWSSPIFWGIFPKLLAALRGVQQHLCVHPHFPSPNAENCRCSPIGVRPLSSGPFPIILTVVSKLITDRNFLLGGINFQLQIQNRAARRINFHYRDRSLGISAENLSLQIQILSWIPINFHYRYRFRAQNELIL